MALKETGRFFAEMVEVPDEAGGCGCIGWVIIIGIILTIIYWIAKFLFNYWAVILGVIIVIAILVIASKFIGK